MAPQIGSGQRSIRWKILRLQDKRDQVEIPQLFSHLRIKMSDVRGVASFWRTICACRSSGLVKQPRYAPKAHECSATTG
ncbi:hypothetical protein V5799_033743 [Amblyomma americanum]|uniref:Uncharacterized protein n=1 Tax=Amblyomma americanum TaxID=6943 RepID=A0AAQ4DMF9_AMBAM